MKLLTFFKKHKIFAVLMSIILIIILTISAFYLSWRLKRQEIIAKYRFDNYEKEIVGHGGWLFETFTEEDEKYLLAFQPFPFNYFNLCVGYNGFNIPGKHQLIIWPLWQELPPIAEDQNAYIFPDMKTHTYKYGIDLFMGRKDVNGETVTVIKGVQIDRRGNLLKEDEDFISDDVKQLLSLKETHDEIEKLFEMAQEYWNIVLE